MGGRSGSSLLWAPASCKGDSDGPWAGVAVSTGGGEARLGTWPGGALETCGLQGLRLLHPGGPRRPAVWAVTSVESRGHFPQASHELSVFRISQFSNFSSFHSLP